MITIKIVRDARFKLATYKLVACTCLIVGVNSHPIFIRRILFQNMLLFVQTPLYARHDLYIVLFLAVIQQVFLVYEVYQVISAIHSKVCCCCFFRHCLHG